MAPSVELARGSVTLPKGTTNNEAEYCAAILAVEGVISMISMGLALESVELRGDSAVVLQQLAGTARVLSARMKGLAAQIKDMWWVWCVLCQTVSK